LSIARLTSLVTPTCAILQRSPDRDPLQGQFVIRVATDWDVVGHGGQVLVHLWLAGREFGRDMSTLCRCTECRRRFDASPAAGEKQRVCTQKCRARRRRKLARKRRREDIDNARAEERARQRQRRSECGAGDLEEKCHAPGSACKSAADLGPS
jgi:hypothetical protein